MRLQVPVAIVASATQALAVCTEWEHSRNYENSQAEIPTDNQLEIEHLECPARKEDCRLAGPKEYNVTAHPFIELVGARVHGGNYPLPWALPRDEADAIYRLAEQGFNDEEDRARNRSARKDRPPHHHRFAPLAGTVSSANLSRSMLDVGAGHNVSLGWNPYHVISNGVLGGCSNETLNGKLVAVAAPFRGPRQEVDQTRLLDGVWIKTGDGDKDGETNGTSDGEGDGEGQTKEDDPDSGAAMLSMGLFSWAVVGSGVLAMGFIL
ncbi:hypothetical protein PG994_009597 [Apiospora phragmitis]|uniref:Uncharacterized protein n=1 Tax=Apiospora phragmitis TaxID=2905665 RepID=A0ABR1U8V9_9PEZI